MERNCETSCPVLVIVTDPTWRATLERVCRAAGAQVRAIGAVAEVERWPEGEIVITDAAHVTPVWKKVGAIDVIALVRNAQEGYAALDRGASRWLPTDSSVAEVTAAIRSHDVGTRTQPYFTSELQRMSGHDPKSDAARADALEQFFVEDTLLDVANALRESLRDRVADKAGQRVPEMSPLSIEQIDSTITLRPVKDRRSSVR